MTAEREKKVWLDEIRIQRWQNFFMRFLPPYIAEQIVAKYQVAADATSKTPTRSTVTRMARQMEAVQVLRDEKICRAYLAVYLKDQGDLRWDVRNLKTAKYYAEYYLEARDVSTGVDRPADIGAATLAEKPGTTARRAVKRNLEGSESQIVTDRTRSLRKTAKREARVAELAESLALPAATTLEPVSAQFQRETKEGIAGDEGEEESKWAEPDQTVPDGTEETAAGPSRGPTDVTWSQTASLPPFQSLLMVANTATNANNQYQGSLGWNQFSADAPRVQSWQAATNATNTWNNSANISDAHSVPITYSEFVNTNSEVGSKPTYIYPENSAPGSSVPAPVGTEGFTDLINSLRGEEAAGQPASAGTESTVSAPSPGTKPPISEAGALC